MTGMSRRYAPRGCTSASPESIERDDRSVSDRPHAEARAQQTNRKGLHGQDGRTAAQHAELVLSRLEVEDRPAWQADDTRLDALRVELHGRLERDGDLAARADDREVLALDLVHDVAALERTLDRRALKVGEVLAGEGEDGRRLAARKGRVVCGGGLIAICRTPEVDVGHRAEVSGSLDWLVSRAVLAETNRVVSGYG